MEELIGLLLVLLFGGIEAWKKAKKKKPQGNVGGKRPALPEPWPAMDMEARQDGSASESCQPSSARAIEDAPPAVAGLEAAVSASPVRNPSAAFPGEALPVREAEADLPEAVSSAAAAGMAGNGGERLLPGTDIPVRDAVIASVILEKKYC